MATATVIWPSGGSTAIYSGPGFTNPTRVTADDSSYATADGSLSPGQRYGNWGFDALIPAASTIDAVEVELEYKWATPSASESVTLRGRVSGVNQMLHTDHQAVTTDTVYSVDLTGDRAWTRAALLDGAFEIVMAAVASSSITVSVDYLKVTVTYTVPAPQPLLVGKVASPAAVRGLFLPHLNLGLVASAEAVRGFLLSQVGDTQPLQIGRVYSGLSGPLGANWSTPSLGFSAGLTIVQNRVASASSVSEGAGVYTAAQLGADWVGTFTLTGAIPAGGRVRLWLVSNQNGSAGYRMAVNADGSVSVDEIGGGNVISHTVTLVSVGDSFGLAKVGSVFTLYYRPVNGDWTYPASGSSTTYDGSVYVGLSVWQGTATVDDLYGETV